nr:2OG-Fe(II) oxygenase [Alteromonas sp. ASW11-130]
MKFEKGIDKFDVHFDSNGKAHTRCLAIIWYLNDVSEGGELHLPSKFEPLVVCPKQGRMVIVPTDWSHYHYVTPPESGDRYSLITFIKYT